MKKAHKYFLTTIVIYLIVGFYAVFSKTIPVELVQFLWILSMAIPLLIPRLAKAIGMKSVFDR